ncbi:MAG: transglycosylase SLT domain-containing protein [Acidobacteria bacterium]|nr:transglycosylase SLT domain-containing protein [Acidobacteriota bacterium]
MKEAVRFAAALALLAASATPCAAQLSSGPALLPTNHPRLPAELSQFWMAPDRTGPRTPAEAELASGLQLYNEAKYAEALPILARATAQPGPLGDYAEYYKGLAELGLDRPADARRTFHDLAAVAPAGHLLEAAALGEAESAEAQGDLAAAVAIYQRLATAKTIAPDDALMRLGRAAKAGGDTQAALNAFSRVHFEFPLSDLAAEAGTELAVLPGRPPLTVGSARYKQEMSRAERLFGGRRYADARSAFENLRLAAQGDDRELVALRIAECDYSLKRIRRAREAVRPYVDKGAHRAEALYFYAAAERELGRRDQYLKLVRRLVDEFADQRWAEEALNGLASYYLVRDEDAAADETLRELYARFPKGRHAERAAWKIGWRAFKNRQYAETARVFEGAAETFPRSDYRPAWLYWSARAHDALKETDLAQVRYSLLAADYQNTYYGRLGAPRLSEGQRRMVADLRPLPQAPAAAAAPPNEQVVRALLSLELYDCALDELRYAQAVWGDSPPIQATIGWVYHQQGDLRAAINAIKRAYPQYMTAGGEKLPTALLKVLYPLDHWPLLRRYAAERQLDPYMLAALILQESNFDVDIRSSANAYGLMQLLPSTGRRYARLLRLTNRFSIGLLTKAEPNLNMGTAYFADLMKRFGSAHYALASYNAGENRVARWIAERPEAPRDEFIDDIPFPETQNYVKRILGTMEDYRRLYGDAAGDGEEDGVQP